VNDGFDNEGGRWLEGLLPKTGLRNTENIVLEVAER